MNGSTKRLVDVVRLANLPTAELRDLLAHKSSFKLSDALLALARRAQQEENLVDEIADAASDPKNASRLIGTVTVSHIAVASLLQIGTPKAIAAAQRLTNIWPEPDRSDLLWFLKTEGLLQRLPLDVP